MSAPLVYVRWVDPHGRQGSWLPLDEMGDEEELIAESVGWLVKETKRAIVVAPHIIRAVDSDSVDEGCGEIVIPRGAIQKMRRLKL